MKILKFIRENWDPENGENIHDLWPKIIKKFSRDDYVELANILVLIDQIPKDFYQKCWDKM